VLDRERYTGVALPRVALACAVVALLTGCAGSAPPPPAPAPPPPPFTVPPPVTLPPPSGPTPTVVIATDGPASWIMPDLVGTNLQAAQNAIQELTDFEIPITDSHDATGAGREQLLDRNWKVCDQNIPAGESITRSSRIDFGAVRTDERC
jgi:hypothetical protein